MQLERQREAFEQRGIHMAAVSFDNVETLRHFAERTNIDYPLLSDPQSELIRAFGVLNDTVDTSHRFYGIPHPGEFLINENSIVEAKFFEEKYADRYTAGHILVRVLGGDSGAPRIQKETDYLTLTTWTSDQVVRGGNRVAIVLEVDLKPKMHVYAPGVEGYIPIEWQIDEPGVQFFPSEFPDSEMLHLPAIDEIVPVYQGKFRLEGDVLLGQPDALEPLINERGELILRGSFRYQACDDKVCYLPQTVPVEWRFQLEGHDRTRVPEEIRRKRENP